MTCKNALCLTGNVDVLPQDFHLQKGFQPALCILSSVRASLLNLIEKLVLSFGTANYMKLFSSVGKHEF